MAVLPLVIVAAVADNGVIGDDDRLIWRLKTDMRRFRGLTMGRPVIMGRKTYQPIGKPLPGRQMIVLTRAAGFRADGAHVAHSFDQAVAMGRRLGAEMGADCVVVAGGTEVYRQALPLVDRIEMTFVHASPAGDAVFPDWDRSGFAESGRQTHPRGPDDDHPFTFATFRRRA